MTAQRLAPDALLVQSNLTGAVGDVQDDPDGPDTAWLTAASVADVEARASFLGPAGNPANRRALEIGAIEWNADYTEAGITGTLAATETSDNPAVAGNVDAAATLAASESADTSAVAGEVGIAGSLVANEPSDIAAISGNLANDIGGTLAAAEAPDMAAIAGAARSPAFYSGPSRSTLRLFLLRWTSADRW